MGRFDHIFAANACNFQKLPTTTAIRLVYLHTNNDDSQIECSLQIALDCRTAPPYHALSYCWGTETCTKCIRCDGQELLVTKDLYSALHRIRAKRAEQLFWIDAICINQHDVLERNSQVSNMRAIYDNAESVLVWLGQEDKHTASIFRTMQTISLARAAEFTKAANLNEWPQQLLEDGNFRAMWQQRTNYDHNNMLPTPDAEIWQHFAHLFQRPWFERVWIIQEISNTCKTVVLCGLQEIIWPMIGIAANWLMRSEQGSHVRQVLQVSLRNTTPPSGITNAHFLAQPERTTLCDSPFLWMLDESRQFKATEPKDRIFALVNHAVRRVQRGNSSRVCYQDEPARIPHLDILVDYRLTMEDLNKLVTVRSIELDQSLEVLNFAWRTKMPDSQTASWIAEWHEERLDRRPPLRSYLFDAAAGTKPSESYIISGDKLMVEGMLIGHIESVDVDIDAVHWISTGGDARCSPDIKHVQSRLEALSTLLVQYDDRSNYLPQRLDASGRQKCMRSFCAFLNQQDLLANSVQATWRCDFCMALLSPPLSREPEVVYTCPICRQGSFDLCNLCYQRERCCPYPEHKSLLQQTKFSALKWFPDTATADMIATIAQAETPTFFLSLSGRAFNRRTLFRTKTGEYGLCPRLAQPGDIVTVLFGGRTPFVFRRVQGCTKNLFRLVSDCYVDGYMDGEAVRQAYESQRERQWFTLS